MSASYGGRASARNATDPSRPTSAITTMNPRGLASGGVNRGVTQLQPQTTDPGRTVTTTPPNWGGTGEYSTNPTLATGTPATTPRPATTRPTGAGYGTPATTQNWINPAPSAQGATSPGQSATPPTSPPTNPAAGTSLTGGQGVPSGPWTANPRYGYNPGDTGVLQDARLLPNGEVIGRNDPRWGYSDAEIRAALSGGEQVQGTPPAASPPATTPTTPPPVTNTPATGGPAVENTTPPDPNTTSPATPSYSTADYFRRALGVTGSGSGSAVLPPSSTQNFTAEQIAQGLGSVTTPTTWEAPPAGLFTDQSTPDTNTLLRIGGENGPGINPTQVQNIINNRGTGAAMGVLQQDLAYQSPANQIANAVRQQQTSQAALPQMFQDLRNVPQLYSNPVTRALLPAEIRQAEETRLAGGPDWRTASFGDAIDGNNVTRAVPTSQFQAPTGSAPTQSAEQRQQGMVADFVNSYLPYRNDPGARGLAQQYNVTELNSALAAAPQSQQAMVANRLTGLTPQQLQVALQTSGLTLPQFLSQAVARLAG